MKTIKNILLTTLVLTSLNYAQTRDGLFDYLFRDSYLADMNGFSAVTSPVSNLGYQSLVFLPAAKTPINTFTAGAIEVKVNQWDNSPNPATFQLHVLKVGNSFNTILSTIQKTGQELSTLFSTFTGDKTKNYIVVVNPVGEFAVSIDDLANANTMYSVKNTLKAFLQTNPIDVLKYEKITMEFSGKPQTFWTVQKGSADAVNSPWGLFDPRFNKHLSFYGYKSAQKLEAIAGTNYLVYAEKVGANILKGLLEVSYNAAKDELSVAVVLAPQYEDIISIDFIPNKQPTDALLLKQNGKWGFWDYKAKELRNKQLPNGGICFTYVGGYTYTNNSGPGVLVGTTADNKVYILTEHGVVK
jgi:hypothetical protein